MAEFVPKLEAIINPLQLMLKKDALLWSLEQTTTI